MELRTLWRCGLSASMVVGVAAECLAGSVITANLPANTAIINISGTQDGAAGYSGVNAAFWYAPFSTLGSSSILEYTVQAGTYGFRVVNPADAAQLFPALSSLQLSQMFTAWTYNSPWATDYVVFDSAALTNSSLYQLFDGAFSNTNGTWYTYGNATDAYNAAINGGFYNLIRSGPNGRNGTTWSTNYNFAEAQTLVFAVPDYYLGDNSGGVSVLISPVSATSIPIPKLYISQSNSLVTLQWTTNSTGFGLEHETNLLSAAWFPVGNLPATAGTNFSVTLPVDATSQFFRLHHP